MCCMQLFVGILNSADTVTLVSIGLLASDLAPETFFKEAKS
jgi:hypothetical protein